MFIQILSRCGAALFLAALVAGCTITRPPAADRTVSSSAQVSDQCKANRKSCLHEGSYDPDERDYAEAEAKRLNQAELARLRRSMGK